MVEASTVSGDVKATVTNPGPPDKLEALVLDCNMKVELLCLPPLVTTNAAIVTLAREGFKKKRTPVRQMVVFGLNTRPSRSVDVVEMRCPAELVSK
jgi:hypothetical protein